MEEQDASAPDTTVYVVTSGEYSDYRISAVFADRGIAEQHAERIRDGQVEEWPLHHTLPARVVEYIYQVQFDTGYVNPRWPNTSVAAGVKQPSHMTYDRFSYEPGEPDSYWRGAPRVELREPWTSTASTVPQRHSGHLRVTGIDKARAEKAFHDRFAKIKARVEGIT